MHIIICSAADGCTDENMMIPPGFCLLAPQRSWEVLCGWVVLAHVGKAISATSLPASRLCAVAQGGLRGGLFLYCQCMTTRYVLQMQAERRNLTPSGHNKSEHGGSQHTKAIWCYEIVSRPLLCSFFPINGYGIRPEEPLWVTSAGFQPVEQRPPAIVVSCRLWMHCLLLPTPA